MPVHKSPKKKIARHLVVMSKMDFQIAMNVYKRFTSIGLSDEEVSFLMGKKNKYVFELLDPTKKAKFKTEHIDILPTILNCKISAIVPNDVKPNETVKIRGRKEASAKKITYKYAIVGIDNLDSEPRYIEKIIDTGHRKIVNQQLHQFTIDLLNSDYFITPRNALEIYLHYTEWLKVKFSIMDLQKSISLCLRGNNGKSKLIKETLDARYFYKSV